MRVSTFYQACDDAALYGSLQETPNLVYYKVMSELLRIMQNNVDKTSLLATLKNSLDTHLRQELFHFSKERELTITDMVKKFSRFLDWFLNQGKCEVVAVNVPCEVQLLDKVYTMTVSMVIQREDLSYEGIVLHTGKNPFSFKGKSTHTNAENSLYGLIPKCCLDATYPGIIISNVYMTNDKDSLGNVTERFSVTQSKGSNVHRLYFDSYFEDGVYNAEKLFLRLTEIVSEEPKKNCYLCPHSNLCNSQTLANKPKEEVVERQYQVPTYTEKQLKVVDHLKGPMLVVAGPGSGKTATLVGRIRALMEKGIEPDFMLVITFTKEAKKELEERCLAFCDPNNLPTISTIHALCYQILRDNAGILGKQYELFTTKDRLSLIDGLLEVFMPIKGLNVGKISGQFGCLKTVSRKLDKYIELGCDSSAFLAQEKDLGEDFIPLAEAFVDVLTQRNYITFDEQVTLCNKFLKEYPEITDGYTSLYQYLMVDEFQDIDASQAEFISLICPHHNIVAVGDDDQSIYKFRGGSNRYMLEFQNTYPDAEIVSLDTNFRSTEALTKVADSLIGSNQNRIEKSCRSAKKGGTEPIYLNGNSPRDVEKAIALALEKGYKYGDIAILSNKNSTLEELKQQLRYPCILEKAYLINEPLFVACFYPLILKSNEYKDNGAMLRLCRLFNVPLENSYSFSIYETISHNKDVQSQKLIEFIDIVNGLTEYSPLEYVDAIASILDLEDTKAHSVLNELIYNNELQTLEAMEQLFEEMVMYEDDTKVSVTNVDAVLLITNHESKGKEFPVVILLPDDIDPKEEEARRVLYVGITRAESLLFVCKKPMTA